MFGKMLARFAGPTPDHWATVVAHALVEWPFRLGGARSKVDSIA